MLGLNFIPWDNIYGGYNFERPEISISICAVC